MQSSHYCTSLASSFSCFPSLVNATPRNLIPRNPEKVYLNFFFKSFSYVFFQKTLLFEIAGLKRFFNFYLKTILLFLNKSFLQKTKTFIKQKSFILIKMLVSFKLFFHMTLVKKNCQNRDRRKRSGYRKMSSSDWREKDQ